MNHNLYFDEKTHSYYIDNKKINISVTQLIHKKLFPEFNSIEVIDKMMNSKNWSISKYFGKNKDQIIKEWEDNGKLEASKGTQLHKEIENYYKSNKTEFPKTISIEFKYFLNFDIKYNYIPFASEFLICDKEKNIAGSIDMLFKKNIDNEELILFDWKRSKDIKFENKFENGKDYLSHIPNSNFWKYAIQLNLYKKIIEINYNMKIIEMYILCLHENNSNYILLDIPILEQEVNNIYNSL